MPQYVVNQQGISTNELSGYQLSQQIVVTDKPDIIKNLDQNAGKLIEQGIEISSWSPQYYYTELDKVRIAMLGIAKQDAQLRAKKVKAVVTAEFTLNN